jgi:hypothetical protein
MFICDEADLAEGAREAEDDEYDADEEYARDCV